MSSLLRYDRSLRGGMNVAAYSLLLATTTPFTGSSSLHFAEALADVRSYAIVESNAAVNLKDSFSSTDGREAADIANTAAREASSVQQRAAARLRREQEEPDSLSSTTPEPGTVGTLGPLQSELEKKAWKRCCCQSPRKSIKLLKDGGDVECEDAGNVSQGTIDEDCVRSVGTTIWRECKVFLGQRLDEADNTTSSGLTTKNASNGTGAAEEDDSLSPNASAEKAEASGLLPADQALRLLVALVWIVSVS
eukprot:TRINITY_DN74235_c0_g1_i1.p1 TRINITY_DN74235_c0_g1~~TRINITY_DN74235_c0_g1_i1.p1  ORF type:complete len:250 (-),score=26.12 TRINITY_DN74235_c0_g1_i1:46-795(-)